MKSAQYILAICCLRVVGLPVIAQGTGSGNGISASPSKVRPVDFSRASASESEPSKANS